MSISVIDGKDCNGKLKLQNCNIFRNRWVLLNILYSICEIKENRLNVPSSRQPVYFFLSGNLSQFLALIFQHMSNTAAARWFKPVCVVVTRCPL